MRAIRILLPILLTAASVSCKTSGDVEPIVIDFTAKHTPTPTPGIVPAPTPPPVREPAEPPPAPASAVTVPPALAPAPGLDRVVREFEDAYNAHDASRLTALFATDARIYDPPDRLRDSGADQIRQSFTRRFSAAPGANVRVSERWTQGNYVVERQVESAIGGASVAAIVISEIRDGRIAAMWVLR